MAERTIDDVLAGLDRVIERAVAAGDRRAYFAVLYRRVTAEVKVQLVTGFFDDPDRIARLDVIFADRYLDAVSAVDRGDAPTASWAVAFDAEGRRRPLVLQHLLVGINAHINLDLGIAAARCSPGAELADLRDDYDRVNAILAAMVAAISADLRRVSPWMALLDVVGARSQTEVVRFSIVTARAGAWRFATELAATPEAAWGPVIDDRDRRVAAVGERVLDRGRGSARLCCSRGSANARTSPRTSSCCSVSRRRREPISTPTWPTRPHPLTRAVGCGRPPRRLGPTCPTRGASLGARWSEQTSGGGGREGSDQRRVQARVDR